ncbi:MAG TPA: alpha/beta hydrolase [Burkholderiales bacterium]|nr:alpha/beta hydrolase [Burkholderiales bacterium]
MPTLHIPPDLYMHYRVDDYTDPWRIAETILMLHGNAESGAVWYGWVPLLARRYRVVRPDMRGFGDSTPMPRDFPWTLDVLIDDSVRLMDELEVARFHLVGAKVGGTIARAFAARRPERVATLTVIGTPAPLRARPPERTTERIRDIETNGVEHWARRSMARRLGRDFPPEGVEWWLKLMGRTAVSTEVGFTATVANADIRADLPRIACPTLVITTDGGTHTSVENTRAWQETIPNSKLLVLPGNSYHVAASHPDQCAPATLKWIAAHRI